MGPIQKLLKNVCEALDDVKAENLTVIDLSDRQSYADYIVLATSTNERQRHAMADRVIDDVYKNTKRSPLGTEGLDQGDWVLIDFGDVICHVFSEEARQHYRLEDMWPHVKPLEEKAIAGLWKTKTKAVASKK